MQDGSDSKKGCTQVIPGASLKCPGSGGVAVLAFPLGDVLVEDVLQRGDHLAIFVVDRACPVPVAVGALVVGDGLHRPTLFTQKQSLATGISKAVVLLLSASALFALP